MFQGLLGLDKRKALAEDFSLELQRVVLSYNI